MNTKGQVVLYTLMLSVVIVILALSLAPVLKSFNDEARADTTDTKIGLNCSNADISTYDEATCLLQDLTMPYFIGAMVGIAGIVAGAKVIWG